MSTSLDSMNQDQHIVGGCESCKMVVGPYIGGSVGKAQACPICWGKGMMPKSFYAPGERYNSTTSNPVDHYEMCRSCHGCGYVIVP